MIKIENIHEATISFHRGEGICFGQKASAFQEHQFAEKILKMLMTYGYNAEVSTDAMLPIEEGEFE